MAERKFLECKQCNRKLITIVINEVDLNFPWDLKANCPYCKGDSKELRIHGIFCSAGFHIPKEDGLNSYDYVDVEDMDFNEDTRVVTFKLKRA